MGYRLVTVQPRHPERSSTQSKLREGSRFSRFFGLRPQNDDTWVAERLHRHRLIMRTVVFFLFLFFFAKNALASPQPTLLDDETQKQILTVLNQNAESLKTLKASLEIGIPHPTEPLVHWCHGLIAFQKEPDFLYLKGYHSLVPLYFLLKSFEHKFWLYLPRQYTVYWGENAVLEQNPDIDLRLIAGDIFKAIAPPKINPAEQIEWQAIETGYRLTLTEADTNRKQEIELDQALNIRKITHYNAAIFRALEITKNDWRLVGQIRLPYEIIIKRFVPRPNHLIMRFKEIRPNETLGAAILDHQFPSDVTYVELTERM
ncbi:MAG: hypothetical protein A3G87_07360 [Omnitrophica bacterium RIFCSPLOWO2_12_FULL_50_11]|nr:MAG: hypothetical protein A3G87_07360 [Omnitrophica bacterium RIFCSPLOWO2_12_FULL_50_11]